MPVKTLIAAFLSLGLASTAGAAVMSATFEDVPLAANSAYYGQDNAGSFRSGGVTFPVSYTDFGFGFFAWEGFAASNTTDTATNDYSNQFSAFPGGGADGSDTYGLSYAFFPQTLALPKVATVHGLHVTNTTLTALTMRDGDMFGFSKPFGGASGNDPDYFLLTITGLDYQGNPVGNVDFHLADYRFADNSLDYIVDQWTWVDLSGLGPVASLRFGLTSTDAGAFGSNTPMYFALDNLRYTPAPEPLSAALIGAGLAAVALATRRRRRPGTV